MARKADRQKPGAGHRVSGDEIREFEVKPVGLLFGAAAVVLPLRLGAKALRETEF
ncbi:MAG: hypothetical protein LC104_07520 [Bacteroidales bacterium]|nr:hypothetical protein [Bacteroidales bacterium]